MPRRKQRGKHRKWGRLDWKPPVRNPKASAIERRLRLAAFVQQHDLACFARGATEAEWAKTGISTRGPWAICAQCVRSGRKR
jgi:hypothetical protein